MATGIFLPVIYVRGTFYQVGYDVGHTFKHQIEELVRDSTFLNDELLPAYNTEAGQKIYDDTLARMKTKFPHYVKELQGISDGSQVPFYKLMLLHIDSMILEASSSQLSGNGCSSVMCNHENVVLGHTEDAFAVAFNHLYIVHADITEECGRHERFSSLCYAGHLPGFCMNINEHGLVYTINIIEPVRVHNNKTPRHFLTRAMLSARNLVEAQAILRDRGSGSSHGFCVNMSFMKQEGPILFHSAEVGPAENNESQLSILTISPGESHVHCNKYLRLKINEDDNGLAVLSSNGRHRVMENLGLPTTIGEVIDMLSNDDDKDYPIYRRGTEKDIVLTIATGIFDFNRREWRLYVDNAKNSTPIAVFSMNL
uniref:Peptidase C45 hydrolase domain-containing protein n=1 Tax=Daphnia galeata TaxID=27404 RepID=A0A8J2RNL3_9CRUS|nr:unnamed protein product [Daphnia galeata]